MRDMKDVLRKVNSATKYPSILTYHEMKGGLLAEALTHQWSGELIATEKVDGTNARLIVLPPSMGGGWLIGSREELLTADGDMVANAALGIVEALAPTAAALAHTLRRADRVVTAYFEVFGHRATPKWKEYGDGTCAGVVLFDVGSVRESTLDMSLEMISSWRDRGNQDFMSWGLLPGVANELGVRAVPELFRVSAEHLPSSVEATAGWLARLAPDTKVALGSAPAGRSEGVVLRSADRSQIAKLRHADYGGTLRRRQGSAKPLKLNNTAEMEGFGA